MARLLHLVLAPDGLSAFQGSIEEMKINYFVIGEKPTDKGYPLYICLHGSGGTHPSVNDGQWKHMQEYYRTACRSVAPKMADRWVGANISAGHPNGVSLVNLYHIPFVIQVGECDSAYNRNKVGAEYGLKLKELKCAHPDGYVNECWLHKGRPHNVSDNDSRQRENLVISDLETWLKGGENPNCMKCNTNAIAWLS